MDLKNNFISRVIIAVTLSLILNFTVSGCKDESLQEAEVRTQKEIEKAKEDYNTITSKGLEEVNKAEQKLDQAQSEITNSATTDQKEEAVEEYKYARSDLHEKIENVAEDSYDAGVKVEKEKKDAVKDMVEAVD